MKRLVWLALFAMMLAVIPAGASTFLAMSPGQLRAQSDAVVQGKVLQVNSFWSSTGRVIVTEAMVQVEEKIRGEAPSVVIVRTFGGTVGGYNVEAHGFPKFAVNDRVLLFLQDTEDVTEVTGYRQGQYRIVMDKAGVEMAVPTVEHGVRLLNRDGSAAAMPKALRLDEFKTFIRSEESRPEHGGRIAN
jgi:hypothetical protein